MSGYSRVDGPWWVWVIAGAIVLALVVTIWWAQSYFEAQAFNRATGSNVSTWDAMWVELRVQEGTSR